MFWEMLEKSKRICLIIFFLNFEIMVLRDILGNYGVLNFFLRGRWVRL